MKWIKGITYFHLHGFSINEGGTPINIHISFPWSIGGFFYYIYFFGRRFYTKRTSNGNF